jgi:hypothetical protein
LQVGLKTRDELFAHLLAKRELISYGDAHAALLGPPKGPWRNQLHGAKLLKLANSGPWQTATNIAIRLDALIVDRSTRKPGDGHFNTHLSYGREAWAEAFGSWPLCRCNLGTE